MRVRIGQIPKFGKVGCLSAYDLVIEALFNLLPKPKPKTDGYQASLSAAPGLNKGAALNHSLAFRRETV
jgi:hypothetical protein